MAEFLSYERSRGPSKFAESVNLACQQLTDAHVTSIHEHSYPSLLGSGAVFEIGPWVFAFTAAHVVDSHSVRCPGWFPDGAKCGVPVAVRFSTCEDFDFAVIAYPKEILNGSRIKPLTLHDMHIPRFSDETGLYVVAGYSIAESHYDDRDDRFTQISSGFVVTPLHFEEWPKTFEVSVRRQPDPFEPSCSLDDTYIKNVSVVLERDLFLSFTPSGLFLPNGESSEVKSANGFSGSGIWYVSNPTSMLDFRNFRYAGMAVAVEKSSMKWIRGIRAIQIVVWLWAHVPEVRSTMQASGIELRDDEVLFDKARFSK